METTLVYAFEPYDILGENPSEIVLEQIEKKTESETLLLTAEYSSAEKLVKEIERIEPETVLGIGTDPDKPKVQIEKVALNFSDNPKPDENCETRRHEKISDTGKKAYETTLKADNIRQQFKDNDVPVEISYHADTYICNSVYYRCLEHIHEKRSGKIKAGFIHIPLHPAEVNRLEIDKCSFPVDKISSSLIQVLENY